MLAAAAGKATEAAEAALPLLVPTLLRYLGPATEALQAIFRLEAVCKAWRAIVCGEGVQQELVHALRTANGIGLGGEPQMPANTRCWRGAFRQLAAAQLELAKAREAPDLVGDRLELARRDNQRAEIGQRPHGGR